ncbi:hypothetical protein L1049_021095 [Liquidambar formosana]|uniref:Uncharacterized protein n=1 Tax=Liquidambar formosana TaxID=63359 RepID=A0AAP0X4V0_LIQFO
MGAHLLPLLTSLTTNPSLPLPHPNPNNPMFSYTVHRRSIMFGGLPWNSSGQTIRTGRSKFNLDDEFFTYGEEEEDDDDDDDDDEFGFTSGAKQRNWWSDDASGIDDGEDEEYWIFKVFRAFGWMLPAIGISMLLGTGPNALFMAIALPLGQSALSLAIDKVWGRTGNSPKPRPRTRTRNRTKKKPFTRTASNIRTSEMEQEENIENGKEGGSYPSWVASNYRSVKKGTKSASSFGGWDELDKQGGTNKIPKRAPFQKAGGTPKQQKKSKLSRRTKTRDRPLMLRLLIAVFPFLGSWTRLL